MLPEKSASPPGSGRPVASGRLERGGGPRLLGDGTVVLADVTGGRLLKIPDEPGPEADLEELAGPARLPAHLLAAAPLAGDGADWLVACGGGFAVLDGDPAAGARWLTRTEPLSCAASDPRGRVWAGTEAGGVLLLGPDGSVTEALPPGGRPAPRGLAFAPDGGTLYLAGRNIEAHPVDPDTGALRRPSRTLARVAEADGLPCGMAADGFGRLWCALRGGAAVRCFAPEGRVLLDVPVPAWQPSGVCLTGGTMLVTTDYDGLTGRGPLDGAVLELLCTAPVVPSGPAVLGG
ncbi:SMP-30/gluconolactonase/LRE family protein [Streptomyces sp. HNM0574]|uniref:SMP-30/gluconolactonase/LRE family protein n=1 Tax=Streptomyces sp. HNM0574 TaxID=2714954 RepID=UPI001469D955|nr:SMP-30/gluconolactonase/LRE family protein [Streptomyces sp. HNM0574]NLU67716.1 SMP-30/gluconolactonase/LRE family protein [Streptomyces sp. HNM0574]